ncbi:MAG: site-2 protease family protein [candidate division WOR-3 bacterium]|nr:site-2 protease family protein [candidate division WOR-3 bacterium]
MSNLTSIILSAPAILFGLTIHEYAHALIALKLGDPTAKFMGRLTLNPLKHLDPIGTISLFLFRLGWAKPVPINPNYFRNYKQGVLLTSLAGPGANFIVAVIFGLLLRIIYLIPSLSPSSFIIIILEMFVFFNLILAIFNLIPIPPLDGSKILYYLLPTTMAEEYAKLERYGFFMLLGIIVLGQLIGFSIFGIIILPFIRIFSSLIIGHSII